jgi:peroxiredoxin Q/BCP
MSNSEVPALRKAIRQTIWKIVTFALVAISAGVPSPMMAEKSALVLPGQEAPDFTLPAQDGSTVSLKDFRGKKAVVLYFYPKDDKLVCKKEACLMRDKYAAFVDAGAEVLGVSSDSIKSHQEFASQRNLPFRLLSDRGGAVRKLYGIPRAAGGLLPGRVTFVIDRQGTVRLTFKSLMDAEGHVSESLRVLKSIDEGKTR